MVGAFACGLVLTTVVVNPLRSGSIY